MSVQEKQKRWTHPRHGVVTGLLKAVLAPYCRWRYGITVEPFARQGDRPYLVLYNHQTPFDQFFVGMAFRGPVYYMATEDIFSLGWISSVIRGRSPSGTPRASQFQSARAPLTGSIQVRPAGP